MEPSTYRLAVLHDEPPERWTRLRDVLDAQGSPPIDFGHDGDALTFASTTGDFMLRARVADALATVWDHGECWRVFRPLD